MQVVRELEGSSGEDALSARTYTALILGWGESSDCHAALDQWEKIRSTAIRATESVRGGVLQVTLQSSPFNSML